MENVDATNDWIKCKSKHRAGREYLFNKKTGESKWLSSSNKVLENTAPQKSFQVKTPAQDRLKRLQNNLIKKQKERTNSISSTKGKKINIPTIAKDKIKQPLKRKSNDLSSSSEVTAAKKSAQRLNSSERQQKLITLPTTATIEKSSHINENACTFNSGLPSTSSKIQQNLIQLLNNTSKKPSLQHELQTISNDLKVLTQGKANHRLNCLRQSFLQNKATSEILQHEDEPMDWQTITETYPFESMALQLNDRLTTETCAVVNENLLRLTAEKADLTQKWHSDHYYIIIDTNVFLRHLSFVNDLSKMKLCGTSGTIIYIPYAVLQELDKLKMRTNKNGLMVLAIRAIRYLNEKLSAKCSSVKAQSAIDERQHLIKVNSADDSIINCCLQVQQHVPHSIIVSEDVNLRTKALSNDLLACAKAELVESNPVEPKVHNSLVSKVLH